MKTSNKIILIAGALPVLSVILLLANLRMDLSREGNSKVSSSGASDLIARTLSLEGFSEISVKGVWKINLTQGDNFLVNVSATESVMREINIEKNKNRLVLDSGTKYEHSIEAKHTTANITIPTVSGIDINGTTTLTLSGLDIDSISIRSLGFTNISGDECIIQDLDFRNTGLSRMDLSNIPVTNAYLDCQGIYAIGILMNGGKLSGIINGLGTFDCQGDVSENELLVNDAQDYMVH